LSLNSFENDCTYGLYSFQLLLFPAVRSYESEYVVKYTEFNCKPIECVLFTSSGSYGGGQEITLSGNGFSENTLVTVCETRCSVEPNNPTTITCITPSYNNTAGITMLNHMILC